MSEEDQSSKTEEPSEQKLRKAREKGDVPITREGGHMLSYAATLIVIAILAPAELPRLAGNLSLFFDLVPQAAIASDGEGISDLISIAQAPLFGALSFLAKVLGIFVMASLIGAVIQGPFVVSLERIKPKPSKLNPLKGIKKIVGAQNLVEFIKNLLKLVLISGMTLWLVWNLLWTMLPGAAMNPGAIPPAVGAEARRILIWILALMVPVALADLVWKRISFMRKQRMSLKEVRDEHKNSEGDPLLKSKRDQIRRTRAKARLATAVPTATLVVTNPTHYAVALRYERGVDQAPVCVAKGADLMAARIRSLAHENEIPVIESVALARALHATAELDQPIPEAHWPAVAELVGFVLDLRRKIRRKLPEGASLRED